MAGYSIVRVPLVKSIQVKLFCGETTGGRNDEVDLLSNMTRSESSHFRKGRERMGAGSPNLPAPAPKLWARRYNAMHGPTGGPAACQLPPPIVSQSHFLTCSLTILLPVQSVEE